jgi:hypothetical protein
MFVVDVKEIRGEIEAIEALFFTKEDTKYSRLVKAFSEQILKKSFWVTEIPDSALACSERIARARSC